MSASSRRKDKEKQEEIQKSLSHIINDFILANIKLIGVAALAVVVIIGAIIGWMSYTGNLNQKALVLENEALELFNEVSAQAPTEEEPDPSAKSWQDVLALYQQIIDQYPGTKSAQRAVFYSGSIEYRQGNYEKAQQYFNTYISKYSKGYFRFQAEESIGYIFEQQGEYQKAIEQFKKLEENAPELSKAELLLAIGRNYESLAQVDQAVEVYQKIVDSSTSVSWKKTATERLNILQPEVAALPSEEPPAEEPESEEEPPAEEPASEEEPPAEAPEPEEPPAEAPESEEEPPAEAPESEEEPPAEAPESEEEPPAEEPASEEEPPAEAPEAEEPPAEEPGSEEEPPAEVPESEEALSAEEPASEEEPLAEEPESEEPPAEEPDN